MPKTFWALLGLGFALVTCSEPFQAGDPGPGSHDGGSNWPETLPPCSSMADTDGDGVRDLVEGCESERDSDKDGTPDYRDKDSDNDGIPDGHEDLNGDGKLGCCLESCGEIRAGCEPLESRCGPSQQCQPDGKCTPALDFLCSEGETSPLRATTFAGNRPDAQLPSFICRPPQDNASGGLKPIQFENSSRGNWKVALEPGTTYAEVTITDPDALESGAAFDLTGPNQAVAGLIVSAPSSDADVVKLSGEMINRLNGLPGASSVTQLSSGKRAVSHDGFPNVVLTQLAIKMSSPKTPAAVRNAVFGVVLGKGVSALPKDDWGKAATDHVLRFQTLLRGEEDSNRMILMGAVATASMAANPQLDTGMNLDDLANGTGLAQSANTDTVECDAFLMDRNPVADIIWVMDESGSMEDNREDVAANAADFFARAVKSGLDFRMAVTGVCNPNGAACKGRVGKFCSEISNEQDHDGGVDRFLLPSEQAQFEACVKNPPGYEGGSEYGLVNAKEAVRKHLPRVAGDPTRIRPNANLVLIIATDEGPESLKNVMPIGFFDNPWFQCQLDADNQAKVHKHIKTDTEIFTGKLLPEAQAVVHTIGGVCNNTCDAEIAHGYNELVKATGGIVADVCQKDLGTTLQIIIDDIVGQASPAKLQWVPISASLAVAVGDQKLRRSRTHGFDYAPSSNRIVFIGVPFPKGSQVVASYRRFKEQIIID